METVQLPAHRRAARGVTAVLLTLAMCHAAVRVSGADEPSFVNFETPTVHPVDLSPSGATLAVCNLPDNRVELFDTSGGTPVALGAVPVGLDPVSVRFRTETEAWVVNHVSDSVSIVDVPSGRVVATINTLDEPADVVFAGTPQRAYVSCSQVNTVQMFDPVTRAEVLPRIEIDGEDPRAMAVSGDGSEVYVAVFESGNATTLLGGGAAEGENVITFPPNVVDDSNTPHGTVNPPPNSGGSFDPPQTPGNPTPPEVGLIVRKNAAGQWMDDNGGDWTDFVSGPNAAQSGRPVGWDLPDHDVAAIDTGTGNVSYATGLMNICMAIAVRPTDGTVTVVGTDATNEVRFEPVLNGTFTQVNLGQVDPSGPTTNSVDDLNGHLTYASPQIAQSERDKSLGDPRGIVWSSAGRGYVTGMGSNNLIIIDSAGARQSPIGAPGAVTVELGEGPTGLALDETRNRLYVLNRFEGSVSVLDTTTETEVTRVPLFDPTPSEVKVGRKHLYDTHKNSGLGQIACASCHVDARMDRLAWDLGVPDGAMKAIDPSVHNLGAGIPGLTDGFEDFHPMKGPMTTQTFQDIIGKEPLHWRGDRDGLEEFNGAFTGLQGDDANLTAQEMQEYKDFLATVTFPPNPHRDFDNTLPTALPLDDHFTTGRFGPAGQPLGTGNAESGLSLYRSFTRPLDNGAFSCVLCHTLPLGMGTDTFLESLVTLNFEPFPVGPNGERHHAMVSVDGSTNKAFKVPHLRNQYEKTGFDMTQTSNRAGFGFLHDGSVDSIARFVAEPAFDVASDQEVADLVALLLAFSGSDFPPPLPVDPQPPGTPSHDTHAAVGLQVTIDDPVSNPTIQRITDAPTLNDMVPLADADPGRLDLVVKGVVSGQARGWVYDRATDVFLSDRDGETISEVDLRNLAGAGTEQTWTLVPRGSGVRIGIDRDEDGFGDRTELDMGSDPANALSLPGIPVPVLSALGRVAVTMCVVLCAATMLRRRRVEAVCGN